MKNSQKFRKSQKIQEKLTKIHMVMFFFHTALINEEEEEKKAILHSGAFSEDFVRTSIAKQNKGSTRKLTSC